MDEKVVIVLRADELLELERIVLDRDRKEALLFLRDRILRKVDEARNGRMTRQSP